MLPSDVAYQVNVETLTFLKHFNCVSTNSWPFQNLAKTF